MSELPNGWIEARFGQLFGFKGGSQPPKATFSDHQKAGYVRLLQIRDFDSDAKAVFIKDHPRWPKCTADDIMIGRYGASVGRILTGKSGAYNVALVKMIFEREFLDASWVRLFLLSDYFQYPLRRISRSAQNGFNKADLEEIKVPLPPLREQRRIVAKVDSVSAKSKRARDQVDHTPRLVEKYKHAILAAAFRGELTREWRTLHRLQFKYPTLEISKLANVVTGSTPPTKHKARFFGGSIPFFKPTDLDAGYHVLNARETLTEEGAAVSRPLPQSSVLVTCIGATIGKTGFARVGCCTNQQINGLVPDLALVKPEWLYWMVVSPEFQQSILDNASATTLPIINKGRFEKLSLPRPPLEEQREIVSRIEKAFGWIDRLTTQATSARKLIDHLDQAVLAKAFRGELVPQDLNDEPASVLLERIRAQRQTPGTVPSQKKQSKPRRGRKK